MKPQMAMTSGVAVLERERPGPESWNAAIYKGLAEVVQVTQEWAVVARFAGIVDTFGPLDQASPARQSRLLEEVKRVAEGIDGSAEMGLASGYDRRVLYEDPDNWSLAAVVLRPGQKTEMHDHGGWGCAVTVQGVERDRRFVHDACGNLVLSSERDYPAGTGYVLDPEDIHQPVGADPMRVTVALHFLAQQSGHNHLPEVVEFPNPGIELAA
ncbi:MAG: hypothetical protein ACJ78Q_05625 [Chloroflexia bacterium]